MPIIDQVLVGALAPLGPRAAPSGIAKSPVAGPVRLGRAGLEGDAQGDLRNHGGPDKAVHHYPHDHYPRWGEDLGALPLLDAPGAFGENLTSAGLVETEVAIGDTFRLGTALLQVSQGRQPCWKLNARFGVPDMSRRVQASGRTGWYYRVLEEGTVQAGDSLTLVDRPAPEWTVERLWRIFYVDPLDAPLLTAIAALEPLAEGWRTHAAKRLASGKVESWTARLDGAAD
jgi:MOSC domain-containing protein YiiM